MKSKSLQRLLLIGLIVIAMMFALSACGSKNDDKDSENPNPEQSEQGDQGIDSNTSDDEISSNAPSQEQLTELFRKGQELNAYSYDVTFNSSYQTSVSSVWISGSDVKVQTENDGKLYTMIYGPNVSYTLDHESKTALKYTWEDSEIEGDGNFSDVQNMTGEIQKDAFQFIGEETVNGEDCYVVETKDLQSDSIIKIWLHKKYGLSMRVELKGATTQEDVLTEISNLKVGRLSSDTFQVPAEFQIVDWDSSTELPNGQENPDETQD